MIVTRDPLYWGPILFAGLFVGLFSYYFDRQEKQISVLYVPLNVLISLLGAVAGAHFIGPALQVVENFVFGWPIEKIRWPDRVSLQGFYFVFGVFVGTMLFNTVVRLFCRRTGAA